MATKSTSTEHVAEIYAREVVSGKILASKWAVLACARHLRDLEHGAERKLRFDRKAAQRAIDFFGFIRHSKGEWAREVVKLEPWQQFILWCVFGWLRADGTRRFRDVFVEVPKKNGKSTLAAGVGLELLIADREGGAEVYCAATKKDQARQVFSEAVRMAAASPPLKARTAVYGGKFKPNCIVIPGTASKFEVLGADSDTLDGLNAHGLIIDELHAHKNRKTVDVLDGAGASRRQPLAWKITTAGADLDSVWYEERQRAEKILQGIFTNDSIFAYIACIDEGDDWKSETSWRKANPNYGVSVKPDYIREKIEKAKQIPSSRRAILQLHLGVIGGAESKAIPDAAWQKCTGFEKLRARAKRRFGSEPDPKALREYIERRMKGRPCIVALDLSSKQDVTAEIRLFPPLSSGEPYVVIPRFWLPEENVEERMREGLAPYDVWVREGFLETTPGDVIDYDAPRSSILEARERFDLREIVYDPWNAQSLANDLQKDGVPVEQLVEFKQTLSLFAAPTKELLEVLIPRREIANLGNPVLRWMASNLTVWEDRNGSKRPVKKERRGKIDGIVALIMALGRAMANPVDEGMTGDLLLV